MHEYCAVAGSQICEEGDNLGPATRGRRGAGGQPGGGGGQGGHPGGGGGQSRGRDIQGEGGSRGRGDPGGGGRAIGRWAIPHKNETFQF